MRNENVLALVRLQEEQDEQQIEEQQEEEETSPKLTRSKAKELNQNPLPILPTNPSSNVAKIIRDVEMQSDEEDEEYQPTEEDYLLVSFIFDRFK